MTYDPQTTICGLPLEEVTKTLYDLEDFDISEMARALRRLGFTEINDTAAHDVTTALCARGYLEKHWTREDDPIAFYRRTERALNLCTAQPSPHGNGLNDDISF